MESETSEISVEDDARASVERKEASGLRRVIRKLWWRALWLLPNAIPWPGGDGDRAYREGRDREANEASRVPEEEELRLSVIWGAELFGPAEADALYEHLARLKWSSAGGLGLDDGAVDWIRHLRSYGTGGGWYNVGMVVRRQDHQRWLMPSNFASLPDEVDYLYVSFFQPTPSLTCALVGFVLKDEAARRYERELNRVRKSINRRSRRRWSMTTLYPTHQKSESLEQVRAEMRAMVGHWFNANLPGYFCGRSINRLPSAELLTTRTQRIFGPEKLTGMWFGWRRLIANASRLDVWTLKDCQGFQFSAARNHRVNDETDHMIVSLCTGDLSDDIVKHYGHGGHGTYVTYCNERLGGILSCYAALAYLSETSKDVRSHRAALKMSKLGSRQCLRVLDEIQTFFDRSLGAPAIASELFERSEHDVHYRYECSEFLAPAWSKHEEPRVIAKMLQESTNWLSKRVIAEERTAREHFEQLATILSVRESVRAQRRMEWLTAAALFVATGSLIAAVPMIQNWFASFCAYLQSIVFRN